MSEDNEITPETNDSNEVYLFQIFSANMRKKLMEIAEATVRARANGS